MRKPQIIAIGGGGFAPDNLLIEQYFLHQTGKRRPAVCFVPTATGDSDAYTVRFYAAFNKLRCTPSHLALFRPPVDIESFILAQDAVYVGGGNTLNMLLLWRQWKLDRILRKAWRSGVVLGGASAGSICWFRQGVTDSLPGRLTALRCLGFLPGSNCPHYDSEPGRRPTYERMIARGRMIGGLAADDCVAFHFIGTRLHRVVSAKPQASAFRVTRAGGKAVEERLPPDYLGRKPRV